MRFFLIILFLFHLNIMAQEKVELVDNSLLDLIIDFGKTYDGIKYKYGSCSSNNNGFDCSGFMYYIFKMGGVNIPRSSNDISLKGKKIKFKQLKKGDFVFFNTLIKSKIGHVGIISKIEKDKILMLHVSSSKGVQEIDIIKSDYWYSKFVFGKRYF